MNETAEWKRIAFNFEKNANESIRVAKAWQRQSVRDAAALAQAKREIQKLKQQLKAAQAKGGRPKAKGGEKR